MANKANVEEKVDYQEANFSIDDDNMELERTPVPPMPQPVTPKRGVTHIPASTEGLVSCLRNETIIVKHVPKQTGMVTDPRHVLYGGMAETAKRTFVVPLLRSGGFVNVLTKAEKAFLEAELGLEADAMNVHNRVNNFWSDANELGISKVELNKQDNKLDLSDPIDYIKYKILLANKDQIAPSLQALQDTPKATYEFVLISEKEESKVAKMNRDIKMQCYKEVGKIEEDKDTLRLIIETIDGRPTASNTPIETLQNKVDDLILADPKLFLKVVTDSLLSTKVMIKRAIEAGIIANRNNFLYLDGHPLCGDNQESTLNVAANYLSLPKMQELRFSIEAKLKNKE